MGFLDKLFGRSKEGAETTADAAAGAVDKAQDAAGGAMDTAQDAAGSDMDSAQDAGGVADAAQDAAPGA